MATSVQTSYDAEPAIGIAGQLADVGPRDVASANNSSTTGVTAGCVVLRSGARLCRPILATDEPTADTDLVATLLPSATTKQTISGATLDGATGDDVFAPPRNVTLTLNSHADWNDSEAIVRGLGAFGEPVQEVFKIPEGGNVTITGTLAFTQVLSVDIPAATSTNGTMDVGLGVNLGPLSLRGPKAAGIAVYDAAREPGTFAQYEALGVIHRGRVKVAAEAAVTAGDPVYVRVVATGDEVRGALRAAPDSTDCVLLAGARWDSTTTGAGIAVVDLHG